MFIFIYICCTVVAAVFEFVAVANDTDGDTITENVKRFVVTQTLMGGLLLWAAWHFIGDDLWPAPAWVDVVFLVVGMLLGAKAFTARTARN